MAGFKYSRGLGLLTTEDTGATISASHPPGLRTRREVWTPPLPQDVYPRLPTEAVHVGIWRVKKWRVRMHYDWLYIDDPVWNPEVVETGTVDSDEILTSSAATEGEIHSSRLEHAEDCDIFSVIFRSEVFGGFPTYPGKAGFVGDETDGFDGRPNGGMLFVPLMINQVDTTNLYPQAYAGRRNFADPQVGIGELRLLGEVYDFPVFGFRHGAEYEGLVYQSVTLHSCFIEPLEFWTWDGRFDSATGL